MVPPHATHGLRTHVGVILAIAGMVFAVAGVEAFVGILYLANFTPILPVNDADRALPVASALEAGAVFLGVIALPLLRYASCQFKAVAWITVGTSLLVVGSIFSLLFAMSAFAGG